MTKKLCLFFFCSFFTASLIAQPPQFYKLVDERVSAVSLGLHLPVGEFSSTHFGGFGAEYTSGRRWYGKIRPARQLVFTYNGGLAYYFGKKEAVSGYDYDYPGYLFLHAFGGISYAPRRKRKLNINLTAGPGLGIYNGNSQFNIGSKLEGSYFISRKISIGPGIILIKESGANAIWSAALKGTYIFQ
jgi:hypothetical protein